MLFFFFIISLHHRPNNDPCNIKSSSQCVQDTSCIWCDLTLCVSGSASGPTTGSCTVYDYGALCTSQTGGGEAICELANGCGWCVSNQGPICLSGTSSGPHVSGASCNPWTWTHGDTPPPPPPYVLQLDYNYNYYYYQL